MWQKSLLYTVVVLHINSSLQCSPWSLTCSSPRKIRKTIKIEISGGETRWFPHYCPRDCCSVVVMFKWIFENRPVPVCPGRHRLYRAPPDPLGTMTVPRPTHTSARGVPGERKLPPMPDSANGGRGEAPPRGRIARFPGRGRGISQHIRRRFPPGFAAAPIST